MRAQQTAVQSRRTFKKYRKVLLSLLVMIVASGPAVAQEKGKRFPEYPETRGQIEIFHTGVLPRWIDFDGELRGRLEGQTAISDKTSNSAVYFLSRIRGGARIRPGQHLTLYMQFHDNHALGLPLTQTASNMRDSFDLRQGFLDLHSKRVRLIAGRQELRFGSERLIGVSDFTNDARSFDGFDLRIGGDNRVDLFTSSVVTTNPTSIDKHGAGLTFHGAYATLNRVLPHFSLQPFLLSETAGKVTDDFNRAGSKAEFTFGGEVSGRIAKHLDVTGLLAFQRGRYASQSINAAGGFVKAAYILRDSTWGLRAGIEYDRATGANSSDPNVRRTFDQQYPSNHNAFGLVDLFGFRNIEEKRINIDLTPSRPLTVLIQGGSLDLASRSDAVYASSGSALVRAPKGGFTSSHIGYLADFSAKYLVNDDLVMNVGYGRLFGNAPLTTSDGIGYLSFTYRFSIVR